MKGIKKHLCVWDECMCVFMWVCVCICGCVWGCVSMCGWVLVWVWVCALRKEKERYYFLI